MDFLAERKQANKVFHSAVSAVLRFEMSHVISSVSTCQDLAYDK